MPRTKVTKTSKRNREAASREEKIREFENTFEGYQNIFDTLMQDNINAYKQQFNMLLQSANSAFLQTKITDLLDMNLQRMDEWESKSKLLSAKKAENSLSISSSSSMRSKKNANPNDEGYLTEDSLPSGSLGATSMSNAAFLNSSAMRQQQTLSQQQTGRMRTPGPLNSARSRRPRLSRSACGDYGLPGSAIKKKQSASASASGAAEHSSRSKMRTPMSARPKAFSCDRSPKGEKSPRSPPTFLRFPKPGELVLSKCGTPLVASGMPGKIAHLNIPLRDGVISMQPKKLAEFQPDILENMDSETLQQLRTLHANIDKIVNMANKAGM